MSQRADIYLFITFSFDDDRKSNFVGVFPKSHRAQNLKIFLHIGTFFFRFLDINFSAIS